MNVWNGLDRLPPETKAAATFGNFDGIHLGHQAILAAVRRGAARARAASLLVTFDPHPLKVLAPERCPRMLQTRGQKLAALESAGLDAVLILRFDETLAAQSAEEFLVGLVEAGLEPASVHVGRAFRFGRDRAGDLETFQHLGRARGFSVEGVEEVRVNGEPVSSTRIREAVARGDIEEARALLGRPFAVEGEVVAGAGRGRALEFPTANLAVASEIVPRPGVYGTEIGVLAGRWPSVTNVGVRPTFGGRELSVETHIVDFDGDLYGQRAEVHFLARLRDEMKFPSADALADQIARDCAATVAYFQSIPLAAR